MLQTENFYSSRCSGALYEDLSIMKLHLKILSFITAFAVTVSGAVGFSSLAAEKKDKTETAADAYSSESYGTPEAGITFADGYTVNDVASLPGFMNGDFSLGLKFWGGLNNKAPGDFVSVSALGENKYLEFKETAAAGDGLTTLRFSAAKLLAGKPIVLVYDCSMPTQVNASLVQWDINRTKTLSSGVWKVLYEAKNETEWNTVVTKPIYPVMVPDGGYYELYFFIKLSLTAPAAGIKIDNLRLAYTNENEVIYDPDGNEIKGEARNESDAEEPTEVYDPSDRQNTDPQAQLDINQDEQGGDNEELIHTIIIVGTIALAAVLAIAPSIIVKAVRSKKDKNKSFSEMLEEMDKKEDKDINEEE